MCKSHLTATQTPSKDCQTMNQDLVRAIADKRLIEFVYRIGTIRIVEPHDYGVRRGVERLLGFQISGESRSGAPHGWKEFDVEEIHQLCAETSVRRNKVRQRAAPSNMGHALHPRHLITRTEGRARDALPKGRGR